MDANLAVEIVVQPHPDADRVVELSLKALAEELAERVLRRFRESLPERSEATRAPDVFRTESEERE